MTTQQSAVLIALSRTHIPRTQAALTAELSFPWSSIRRTINELRGLGHIIVKDEMTGTFSHVAKPASRGKMDASMNPTSEVQSA